MSKHLVLFSGGLDSTALVYKRLREGCTVDVLFIEAGQHALKREAERKVMTAILQEFDEMIKYGEVSGNLRHRWTDVEFRWDVHNGPARGFAFSQVLPWLTTAFQAAIPGSFVDHASVDIAYCLGDQISLEMYRIQEVWKLMWSIMRHDPMVPLEFPFMKTTKADMMQILPGYLRKMTWTCELPDAGDPDPTECGKCVACVRKQVEEETFKRVYGALRDDPKPLGLRQDKDEEQARLAAEKAAAAPLKLSVYQKPAADDDDEAPKPLVNLNDIESIDIRVQTGGTSPPYWSPRPYGMTPDVTMAEVIAEDGPPDESVCISES
jgi:7-cyano-7-deazaguanine synthase in queuosine biosynthesis